MLFDNHGRRVNYLRLSVTDKCNLRCFYCMPENGLNWLDRSELLTYDELLHLCIVLINSGIEKIRITGGEPFVRKDLMSFLTALSKLDRLRELSITTNGVLTAPYIPELKKIGVRSINLSLDTTDRNRFFAITRRDELPAVMNTFEALLRHDMEVKLNAVVMDGKNTQDIIPMVELAKDNAVSVRFIEEMPFNGGAEHIPQMTWDHIKILETIKEAYPDIQKIPDPAYSTAYNYKIPGFKGTIGIIAAYTRSFCGSCNRIRVTPAGMLKTCLYDDGVMDIKEIMRNGITDDLLQLVLINAMGNRAQNGFEAEKNRVEKNAAHESMATIGG